jgi:hypothetical protein
MNRIQFYHICAKGADARNFIICDADYYAAFNLIGVCAANCRVVVVSFSLEDTHPHILLWGTYEQCTEFMLLFENMYRHYAAATRVGNTELFLHCEFYPIGDDEDYLRNVAVYTVIQPTKDGKPVMYYDYRWGTGSMYFRNRFYTPVWLFDEDGVIHQPERFGDQDSLAKRSLLHSRKLTIPDDWRVCNGFILPDNYIDIPRFESIYHTHNRYRVWTSSPKKREEEMNLRMAEYRGVTFEDLEARQLCGDICKQLYGTRDPRRLSGTQRIAVAQQLRNQYRLTFRQLSTLVRLPETEIRAHVR